MSEWMRTDEREDVLSSLKMFNDSMTKAVYEEAYWKWSVISLHSSLQSLMAFHLGFGNDLLVMRQEDAEAWLEAHENETDYPEVKMDGFLNLYKKIKKHEILGYKFSPQGQEGKSVKRINTLRNEFIHFMPKGWSIEVAYMIEVFTDCLNVIERLGSELAMRWEDEEQKNIFEGLVKDAKGKASAKKNH
ncbi:MAG: hypothetical protein AB2556_02080 [Candidatus Thiodiazotropha sp.]